MAEIQEVDGFRIGDKVWADKAKFDYFPEKFIVTGFSHNAFGMQLVNVADEERPGSKTVFYPEELSHRD
jgi:hypothetical protein